MHATFHPPVAAEASAPATPRRPGPGRDARAAGHGTRRKLQDHAAHRQPHADRQQEMADQADGHQRQEEAERSVKYEFLFDRARWSAIRPGTGSPTASTTTRCSFPVTRSASRSRCGSWSRFRSTAPNTSTGRSRPSSSATGSDRCLVPEYSSSTSTVRTARRAILRDVSFGVERRRADRADRALGLG